jgi:glycosyltransferase involved in cell wall biosynthesis
MKSSSTFASPLFGQYEDYNTAYVVLRYENQFCGHAMSRNVAIIYWGSRGGGPRQLLNLVNSVEENREGLFFYISSNNELLHEFKCAVPVNLVITKLPRNKICLLAAIPQKMRAVQNTLRDLKSKKITRIYFLLPHPWDLSLAKRIIGAGEIEVWRGIHDLKRHPGDIWPNAFTTKKLIKNSSTLVCFSDYIQEQLLKEGKPVVRGFLYEVFREPKLISPEGSVLFIGRIRKYKGLELLAKAWPLVVNPDKSLTVAGDGDIPLELEESGAKIVNRWLSNSEIEELIRSSRIVVLPYTEASQSGVVAIAHSLSTPVVITPVGGLIDQVTHGLNGLVSADTAPESLASAIDTALSMSWEFKSEPNPLPNFIAALQAN